MRCPIDGSKMEVTNTYEKRASVERRHQCLSCPFRCHTLELISDTKAFVHAMRQIIRASA